MVRLVFSLAYFPDILKRAFVQPRIKKSTMDPTDIKSFRPISNPSFLCKLIERLVSSRFDKHADLRGLLPTYRRYHSTETTIIAVHNEIVRSIDDCKVAALVLLDLSAAFDTVDHAALLDVLDPDFDVGNSAHDLVRSYLSNRSQTFCAAGVVSIPVILPCSVLQGSVFGPRKFISYTADIVDVIDAFLLKHHLYADDTQLPVAVKESCASRWLQLNADKTDKRSSGSHPNRTGRK